MLFQQVQTKYLLLSLSKEKYQKKFISTMIYRPFFLLSSFKYKNNFLLSTKNYFKTIMRVPKQPSFGELMGINI